MALEQVLTTSLFVTHIFDGEEIVAGGDDGQVYVATFASRAEALRFIEEAKKFCRYVSGERGPIVRLADD